MIIPKLQFLEIAHYDFEFENERESHVHYLFPKQQQPLIH